MFLNKSTVPSSEPGTRKRNKRWRLTGSLMKDCERVYQRRMLATNKFCFFQKNRKYLEKEVCDCCFHYMNITNSLETFTALKLKKQHIQKHLSLCYSSVRKTSLFIVSRGASGGMAARKISSRSEFNCAIAAFLASTVASRCDGSTVIVSPQWQ